MNIKYYKLLYKYNSITMYILYVPRSIHKKDPYIYLSIAKFAYSNIICILLICNFTYS